MNLQTFNLQTLAKSSPTAAALLAQIQAESKDHEDKLRAEQFEADAAALRARQERIAATNDRIQALLLTYDALRVEMEQTLIQMFALRDSLPSGVEPKNGLLHLQKVNIPKAAFGRFDELYPVHSTMEAALAAMRAAPTFRPSLPMPSNV